MRFTDRTGRCAVDYQGLLSSENGSGRNGEDTWYPVAEGEQCVADMSISEYLVYAYRTIYNVDDVWYRLIYPYLDRLGDAAASYEPTLDPAYTEIMALATEYGIDPVGTWSSIVTAVGRWKIDRGIDGGGSDLAQGAAVTYLEFGFDPESAVSGIHKALIVCKEWYRISTRLGIVNGGSGGGSNSNDEWWRQGEIKYTYQRKTDAPNWPSDFITDHTIQKKINKDQPVRARLQQVEPGEWKKIFDNGTLADGTRVSMHYFRSKSGRVFDVELHYGWSTR